MGSSQSTWGVSLVTPAHTEPSLIMVDADACNKICDIYDWDGKGELDLFYLGDIMYAMGFNTTKKVCVGLGQTDEEGKKFAKFDDVWPWARLQSRLQTAREHITTTWSSSSCMTKTPTAPCSPSWTTSSVIWETRFPRNMCKRCSLRSATLRMRMVSSPTCPSLTD